MHATGMHTSLQHARHASQHTHAGQHTHAACTSHPHHHTAHQQTTQQKQVRTHCGSRRLPPYDSGACGLYWKVLRVPPASASRQSSTDSLMINSEARLSLWSKSLLRATNSLLAAWVCALVLVCVLCVYTWACSRSTRRCACSDTTHPHTNWHPPTPPSSTPHLVHDKGQALVHVPHQDVIL